MSGSLEAAQVAGPGSGARLERRVQVVIMLAIGAAAGAASFTHVHDVAASHGQQGWLAWADTVVLELMSIASGLELRRRHRVGRSAAFPAGVVAAVLLSISARDEVWAMRRGGVPVGLPSAAGDC